MPAPIRLFAIAVVLVATQGFARAGDLAGSWSGSWQSCTSGHKGPLHATFCKIDDSHYRASFHGRFFVVVPFRYSVTLTVTGQEGDKVTLAGESYLGRLFGTFHYTAEATDCEFTASYTSCRDDGRFVLKRCCGR